MTFEEAIEEAILALGNTPEEISSKLREMNIKGFRAQIVDNAMVSG